MAVVIPSPTHPTFADGTPVPGPCAVTAFRTSVNAYVAGAEGMAQLDCAFAELRQAVDGSGARSGGVIAAGAGLSVTVAALTAFVGTYVETNASTTVGSLTPSGTRYIWLRQDGTFTATDTSAAPSTADGHGLYLLWGTATTDGSTVTAVTNNRVWLQGEGYVGVTGAKSDADYTLADAEHTVRCVRFGWTGWTGGHNVIVPTYAGGRWHVINATGQTATVKTAAGTGIAVASTKSATLLCDGTNVVRLTADA